ncbi:polysaccharide pyruvyl transferase family protein [Heyndrickxia coagulans]
MINKILIINAHSSKNKGDAAIIISMIQTIKKYIPNSQITISSRYPNDDSIYSEFGCKVVEQLTRFPDKKWSFFKRLIFLLKELNSANKFVRNLKIPKGRSKDIFESYQDADIVVSCGGGFLYSHPKYHIEASLIMHLAQIYFASKLGKKVIIYSQSIGPFRSTLSKKIANLVLKKVNKITIREQLSKTFLEEIGIKNSIVVGDSAFTMQTNRNNIKEILDIDKTKFNIGVTVRQWEFPGQENSKELYGRYIQSVADAIEYVVTKYNANVFLVPQVTGPTSIEDDRIANTHVIKRLNDEVKRSVKVLNEDYRPEELKEIYSNFNLFLGTRMHSNIFSLSSIVPTVAIAYEPKTTGIMKLLNLSRFVVDINTINSEVLIKTIDKCINDLEYYKKDLQANIPIMIKRAEEPAKLIQNLIIK